MTPEKWMRRIMGRRAGLAVIGLGHRGLPLAIFLVTAMEEVVKYRKPGQLYVLESTTYPGITQELILPMLEGGALR